MELGPHAAFIWLAYGITAVVIASMIAWLLLDGREQARRIADLDARGVKRRSARRD